MIAAELLPFARAIGLTVRDYSDFFPGQDAPGFAATAADGRELSVISHDMSYTDRQGGASRYVEIWDRVRRNPRGYVPCWEAACILARMSGHDPRTLSATAYGPHLWELPDAALLTLTWDW